MVIGSRCPAATFQVDVPEGDARVAIQAALDQAVSGDKVQLGSGIFRIEAAPAGNWHLSVGPRHDFTLQGTPGATRLVFCNPRQGGIFVAGGSQVWIKDVIIDYDPLPFTQGRIQSIDPNTLSFVLKLDPDFPSLDQPWFRVPAPYAQLGYIFDPAERRLKAGAPDFTIVESWTHLEGDSWRITFNAEEASKLASMASGDRFVLLARGGEGALFFGGCTGGGVEHVTIHAAPSLTCSLIDCDAMTVRGMRIVFEAGSRRLMASNGDGIHCQRNRRGPVIEDCVFEGMGDDGVNIYAPPLVVRVAPASDTLILAGPEVRAGDALEFFDPRAGRIRGQTTVAEVQATSPGLQQVRLDTPIDGIVSGPDHRVADTAFNLSASGRGYVIRNNTFRNHRRHGVLLRAGDGLIEGNCFENNGGFGVVVSNEPGWPEGPTAEHVTIRGNTFIGGGTPAGYADSPIAAAIYVRGISLTSIAAEPIQRDIHIEHNTFTDPPGAAVLVGAARAVRIEDNHVTYTREVPPDQRRAAVIVEWSRDVIVQGLVLAGFAPPVERAVTVFGNPAASGTEDIKIGAIESDE